MKKLPTKYLILIVCLSVLFSCGSDDNDNNDDLVNLEFPQEEDIGSFSTRLSPSLLISGIRCEGNETTIDATGNDVLCPKDDWLITIDNVNTCTAEGFCTEVAVTPIVAELDRNDRIDVSDISTFFEIDPVSAVTQEQSDIANDYLVRFEIDDETARVIPR
jgi:hypothetical protein